MTNVETLHAQVTERLGQLIKQSHVAVGELTLELERENLLEVAQILRDEKAFAFNVLVDVCGVDYLLYGLSEWETEDATTTGFERGVIKPPRTPDFQQAPLKTPRFAAVYHLLSLSNNQRIRLRVFLEEKDLIVPSVTELWPSANWFEREAFDLFGILFQGHPDLRRILTDYGFVGHPFRKDFPLIGNVEVRYDAELKRVVYDPVSIAPRVLEPKVIRKDNRYESGE